MVCILGTYNIETVTVMNLMFGKAWHCSFLFHEHQNNDEYNTNTKWRVHKLFVAINDCTISSQTSAGWIESHWHCLQKPISRGKRACLTGSKCASSELKGRYDGRCQGDGRGATKRLFADSAFHCRSGNRQKGLRYGLVRHKLQWLNATNLMTNATLSIVECKVFYITSNEYTLENLDKRLLERR